MSRPAADGPVSGCCGRAATSGYGAAANAGVAVLDPAIDWVMVINPDVVLGPGAIDELLAAADRYPAGGAFGPLITTPDGVVYPSARHLPSIGAGVGHALFGWWWPTNPWTRQYRQDAAAPVERTPAGSPGRACCCDARRSTRSTASIRPTSCISRTSTSATGWPGPDGPASTARPRGRPTRVVTPPNGRPRRWRGAPPQRLSLPVQAVLRPWQAPLRVVLRAGLAGRAFLSKRSAKVAGGADLPDRGRREPASTGVASPRLVARRDHLPGTVTVRSRPSVTGHRRGRSPPCGVPARLITASAVAAVQRW